MKKQFEEFSHYYKDVSDLNKIDIYRILILYDVKDPCLQHAIKKLLVAGNRGSKSLTKDVQEAIASLNRFLEIVEEDGVTILSSAPLQRPRGAASGVGATPALQAPQQPATGPQQAPPGVGATPAPQQPATGPQQAPPGVGATPAPPGLTRAFLDVKAASFSDYTERN